MLTMLGYLVPDMRDIRYSIMVEYCCAQAKYYCKLEDPNKIVYWSNLASKYLIKRLDLMTKKRV